MKTPELAKLVQSLSGPLGYRRKGNLFWKSGNELTTLIKLQGSRWGGGVYINYGVIPTDLIIDHVPPGVEYWPFQERAESSTAPFKEQFVRLAMNNGQAVLPEEMVEPLQWLLAWIEEHLGNADRVRQALLGMTVSSTWTSRIEPMPEQWIMLDWAKSQLKEPLHYFNDTPYYRKT